MAGIFGTQWKLNANRSVFSSGFAPATETRQYDELKNGYKLTVKGTQRGTPYEWSYTAYYDGKSHPVHGRDDADGITIYAYGDGITGGWFTKDGVNVAAYDRTKKGAFLIVTAAGRRPDGSAYFDTIHYSE